MGCEQEKPRRHQADGGAADEQRAPRPEAQHEERADEQPCPLRRDDEPPRGGAAQLVTRDRGPEDVRRPLLSGVQEAEADDDPPQPCARAELAPPFAQVGEDVRRRDARAARDPHQRERQRGRAVREGVERERPASSGRGDEDAAGRCARHAGRVQRQAEEHVRRLEQLARDGLRDDPGRRREEERGRRPAHELERGELPQLGSARQEQQRGDTLCCGVRDVRADHDVVPRQPVRPHAAEEEEDDLRDRARREHEPHRRERVGQVEDGERERDRRDRRPGERDRPAEEEKPELALSERREASSHGACRASARGRRRTARRASRDRRRLPPPG